MSIGNGSDVNEFIKLMYGSGNGYVELKYNGSTVLSTYGSGATAYGVNAGGSGYYWGGSKLLTKTSDAGTTKSVWDADDNYGVSRAAISAYVAANSGSGSTSPGGSNTQIQYNNAGAFGGTSGLTWDGTNMVFDDNKVSAFGTAGASDSKILWNGTSLFIASSNYHYLTDIAGNTLFNTNSTGVNIPADKTYQMGGVPLPQYVKVSLDNATVKALYETPYTLIAAPGAGKAIVIIPQSCMVRINYSSAAFDTNTEFLFYTYGISKSTPQGAVLKIDYTATKMVQMLTIDNTDETYRENAALMLTTDQDITTGSGTIDLYITYRIITL